jgi:hypothetical protein
MRFTHAAVSFAAGSHWALAGKTTYYLTLAVHKPRPQIRKDNRHV